MFGICDLSIVPVRTEASDKSELCTQLLFGDAYAVTGESENGKWVKIKIVFDDYEGWIDKLQHMPISEDYFKAYILHPQTVCMDDVALIENELESRLITLGATLPFLKGRILNLGTKNFNYQGELYEPVSITKEFVQFIALRFLNTPYLWGGKSLFGIDCSGFTQLVLKILGYKIKRDAYQQVEHGQEVKNVNGTNTGDLAFFENDNGRIIHVGMIMEENKIIHAHGKVRMDILDEKGILNLSTKKYSHKLTTIKRIISLDNNIN